MRFYEKHRKKSAYISETPPNQPDYPWFPKCTLNLGLEKPMLINSTDISHLPPSATGLLEIRFWFFEVEIKTNRLKE